MNEIKEAIKTLREEHKVLTESYQGHLQNGGESDCADEYYFGVLELAIEALEKQVPKKPIKEPNALGRGFIQWVCPECEHQQDDKTHHQFCWNCGQKFDWSEEWR